MFLSALLFSGCSVSKFIPEGHYLLDDVKIESDNREVKPSQMNAYVRQTPNAKWFSLFKLPLAIYSASGRDSTKWMNRFLRKIGEAPRIYDPELAEETRQQIEQAVQNMGYMGARVELSEHKKNDRLKARYRIFTGEPYIVEHIAYDINDYKIDDYMLADSAHTLLHPGMRFDVNQLDAERQRITRYLQDHGYYRFNKDFITYQADTMLNTRKVDLTMQLMPYQRKKEDEPTPHRQYVVREVNYLIDVEESDPASILPQDYDSLTYKGLNLYFNKKPFLRPSVLADNTFLRPGR